MRTTSRALRRTAAGAASLLAVALLAACGGSEKEDASGGNEGGKGSASPSATAGSGPSASPSEGAEPSASAPAGSGGKTLTAAELEAAAVTTGEAGDHAIAKRNKVDHTDEGGVKASRDECAPIARAMLGTTTGGPAAIAERQALQKPDEGSVKDAEDIESAFDTTKSMITLGSYQGGGAQAALASLTKGLAPCAGGFTAYAHDEDLKIVAVEKDEAPELGDESTAFTVVNQEGHDKASFKIVVVRKGNTLAYISSMNLGAIVSGKDFDFPLELAQAQAKKLP